MKELYNNVLCFIRKIILSNRLGKFDSKSYFDKMCIFEGANRLGYNSRLRNTKMGFASYVANNSDISNTEIGKYSCIGPHVKTLLGRHPVQDFVSIHPSFFSMKPPVNFKYVREQKFEEIRIIDGTNKMVKIGNDVWIGGNVSIIDGVTINDGAIVAAGAVVVEDVPAYSIVGGIPAKIIRYRFKKKEIDFLLGLRWWEKSSKWISENAEYFNNVELLRAKLEE